MRKGLIALVFLAICPFLSAQQSMNNDSVIKLVKAGLSDDLIVNTINAQPGIYDTSANGLIALKSAGASDKVVSAIVMKATAPQPPPQAPVPGLSALPAPASGVAPAPTAQPLVPQAAPPPPPPFHSTDGKVRIYVTDHPMFESNLVVQGRAAAAHTQAGDDPRTVEIQADILKVCPVFIIASNNPDRSDLVLVFRRRGGSRSAMFAFGGLTGLALSGSMKVDGASLFQSDGDMVYATKQNTVEKSIKDVCAHITPSPSN